MRACRDRQRRAEVVLRPERQFGWRVLPLEMSAGNMSIEEEALHKIELAAAELAVLKQELVLQQLIDTREPTQEAREILRRLRQVAEALTAPRDASHKHTVDDAAA
jgi:hypothetical protein